MMVTTIRKIKLSDEEIAVLRRAKEIILDLAVATDDDCYSNVADSVEEIYLHEPWELGFEEEDEYDG